MRRSQRILVFLIAVGIAAGVMVATLAGHSGDLCTRWKETYRAFEGIEGGGTLQFVNLAPGVDSMDTRPEGCQAPG
jgi:hypothetical protein